MSPSMDSSDEARPLLSNAIEVESQGPAKTQYTPLPTLQFSMLCLLRVLDPMNFSQIFPYVNEFMSVLHVTDDPSQIGFYSGLVESSFAVAQLLAIYPWGFLSDKLGRRPVVLMGVIGVTLSTLLFGLSGTFVQALIARALAGLFSGNVAVIPTMLIEITDKSNQAFAFPVFGLWWPVGAIIGPLIGGTFANAATKFPEYFTWEIFKIYPYFLPGLIVASFSLVGLVFGYFFLEETRNGTSKSIGKNNTSYGTPGPSPAVLSLHELASIPIIRALCASGASLSFISTGFDVLFVLFCYSPIENGGLAFPASHIGFALATAGAIAGLVQVLFMPTVLRRVDHAKMYHFCMKLWPYTFLILPFLNLIARHNPPSGAGYANPQMTWALWAGIALLLIMTRIAFLAYSVNMLLVKRYAPNPASMGSTTALIQFSICFSRAFSPAFASSVFTLSVNKPVMYGYSWVLVMAMIAFTGSAFSKNIVKESAKF